MINKKLPNLSIMHRDSDKILQDGIQAMTIACDALTQQNQQLNEDVKNLKAKVRMLEEKIILNMEDKE